jgi:hypothetical protein
VKTGWVGAILSLGSGTILKFIEDDLGTVAVTADGYWNGPVSVISDVYHSLPDELRSIPMVTGRLEESGRKMLPERVRDHLEKVLIKEVTQQDVVVTARTLRILADLGDFYYSEGDVALASGKHFVKPLLDTIGWSAAESLASAIGRLLGAFESNKALEAQLAAIELKQRWREILLEEQNSGSELGNETGPDRAGGEVAQRLDFQL